MSTAYTRASSSKAAPPQNEIILGDCLKVLAKLPPGYSQLVIADPPYNIGYEYDKYDDSRQHQDYCDWSREWMEACKRVLAANGSMYVAIGDDYAAELRIIGRDLGLTLRNWIVWHYTFGQSTRAKFARSHIHIFYFVADPNSFTFNGQAVRVLSDRQKQYADRRANPAGKIPDDTWVVFPRVCGTFGERAKGPNQLPEALVARIVRASSNPGDLVLDPFCGSGTSAAVAAPLSRRYLSIDISAEYARQARNRIKSVPERNDRIEIDHLSQLQTTELIRLYQENEIPVGLLLEKPQFLDLFTGQLNRRLAGCSVNAEPLETGQIESALRNLRKRNFLPVLRTDAPSLRTRRSTP